MTLAELDVVFLVWREAPAMLARHHAAVAAALPSGWPGTALLFENGAAERTARAAEALVRSSYPHATRLALRSRRNRGFARAMNLALAQCPGRYVALVNSDGRPAPGMFERLVSVLDEHPDAIWAAPGVHGPGEPGHPPGPPHPEPELPGMALAIRREAFLALGGFDPLFFFYNEDFDASRRIRAAGGKLLRVPSARFDHGKGGRSRRGRLIREFWFAATHQALEVRHAARPAGALGRLLASRRRALAEHARAGDWPGLAGIGLAAAGLPVTTALALGRRRAPWDERRLRAWLARTRPRVQLAELAAAGAVTPAPMGQLTPVPPSPQ